MSVEAVARAVVVRKRARRCIVVWSAFRGAGGGAIDD